MGWRCWHVLATPANHPHVLRLGPPLKRAGSTLLACEAQGAEAHLAQVGGAFLALVEAGEDLDLVADLGVGREVVRFDAAAAESPGGLALDFQGTAVGGPVEPAGQRLALADRMDVPRQDKEGRLKSVLGVLLVAQHPPADAQHQRPVAFHEAGKGVLIAVRREVVQELAVSPVPVSLSSTPGAETVSVVPAVVV